MNVELNALSAPFPLSAVDFKPQVMNKERTSGMATTYVDARAVAERLDSVLPFGWSAGYRTIHSETDRFVVECALTLTLSDGRTVTRADVGESDNGANEASRHKSAYSDALKRAAVQFGVGRYLYDLPKMWADYDAQKKTWTPAGLKKLEDAYSRVTQPASRPAAATTTQTADHGLVVAINRDLTEGYGFKASERAEKLEFIGWLSGTKLTSSKDLTPKQATTAKARLSACPDQAARDDLVGQWVAAKALAASA